MGAVHLGRFKPSPVCSLCRRAEIFDDLIHVILVHGFGRVPAVSKRLGGWADGLPGAIIRPQWSTAFLWCESGCFAACMAKLNSKRCDAMGRASTNDMGQFMLILIGPET